MYLPKKYMANLTPNHDTLLEKDSVFIERYLKVHPGPSWKLIAHAMYCRCEYKALEIIQRKYLHTDSS